ncbi:T9SS type A sorting domain-containing protein [Flavobacterium sp. 7A]|uniref:T9SS type A sorting domain-containing protein n=1 Tax=Flavobacterium sp. 7A TaxID=2940571 RepID=UPI002227BA5C|nr:T9SS type A sorting domain-containing protein [Flavobacterium sp. 7A]MCW2118804.1 hypothetical protein [Flavobacterium sp. 7A]
MKLTTINQLLSFLAIALLFSTSETFAQNESDFYIPFTGGITKNLKTDFGVDNLFSTDDSQALRDAIDAVAAVGGGNIYIPEGNYTFQGIGNLKSNINIIIDAGVVIRPLGGPTKFSMFLIGNDEPLVENWSITGVGGRFTIDLTQTENPEVFVFTVNNVKNFKLSDFNILDKKTEYSNIAIGPAKYKGTWCFPENGVVENCDANDCDYGYGLMQMQAGKHIYFNNISSTGGIPLRLESGWNAIQGTIARIDDIYARNVRCYNGQSAVFLSPHTMKQGVVDIRNITTVACEWAVKTENGYATSAQATKGHTPGSFDENSVIANINATYGDNATVRSQVLRYIPCELRSLIGPYRSIDRTYPAPSVAPIGDLAPLASKGTYQVKIWDVRHSGYMDFVPTIVNESGDDYEDCTTSVWNPNPGTISDRFNLLSLVAPPTVNKDDNVNLSINYQADKNADIYFQLLNNSTGKVESSTKATVEAGKGTKTATVLVPSSLDDGEYVWKVYVTKIDGTVEDDQEFTSVIVGEKLGVDMVNIGNALLNDFVVYPNPTSEIINIKINDITNTSEIIEIFNILGDRLYEKSIASRSLCQINVSGFPAGLYFIKIGTSLKSIVIN